MNKTAYGLTAENLLRTLPDVLRRDNSMYALAASIAQVLAARPDEIDRLALYSRIDGLPEQLLDILAYDFKVDWWDADYTLEQKRQTLKDSWHVHRTLGTKYAVETAISAIYKNSIVQEWWEYGGKPYRFKLLLDVSLEEVDPAKHQRVLDRVAFYKNLRSHLEAIEYIIHAKGTATTYVGAAVAGAYLQVKTTVKAYGLVLDHVVVKANPPPVRAAVAVQAFCVQMISEVKINGME